MQCTIGMKQSGKINLAESGPCLTLLSSEMFFCLAAPRCFPGARFRFYVSVWVANLKPEEPRACGCGHLFGAFGQWRPRFAVIVQTKDYHTSVSQDIKKQLHVNDALAKQYAQHLSQFQAGCLLEWSVRLSILESNRRLRMSLSLSCSWTMVQASVKTCATGNEESQSSAGLNSRLTSAFDQEASSICSLDTECTQAVDAVGLDPKNWPLVISKFSGQTASSMLLSLRHAGFQCGAVHRIR